ncbi:hypothetical protein H2248_002126 [Termitomyces sp. 'cryptogamus']|nr:hypothetical protein H2248_002126 [Termitomyces sp. 'cryptogamus']
MAEGLRLLALDNGGIRGLSELFILEDIMNRIKAEKGLEEVPKPCEYFDVIGGTGTGGLIAILLGRLCLSVEEAIGVYTEFAGRVFTERKHKWQNGTFKANTFEAVIKAIVARYDDSKNENALMMNDTSAQRNCKTFVCAMSREPGDFRLPRLFRSYPRRSLIYSDPKSSPTIWEAARATTASPLLFKPIAIGTPPKEEYINGGLECNNPTFHVFREAESTHEFDRPVSCVVSVGAGNPRTTIGVGRPDKFQGGLSVDLLRALEATSVDCENVAEKFARTHGDGNKLRNKNQNEGETKTYFRFSVRQGLQDVSLAEWTKIGDVKTHTMQYLRGAVVDVEIDRVRDLLLQWKSAGSDEYRRRPSGLFGRVKDLWPPQRKSSGLDEHRRGHFGLNATSSTTLSKQIEVTSSLRVIFGTAAHYKCLLHCDEPDAQKVLNAFQKLLDTETYQNRAQLIAAMHRLSSRTNLYPTRFFLKGSESLPSLGDEPVAAGSFADVYRVMFQGEDMCFKAVRSYQRSQVEHMAKVYAKEAILWAQLSHPNILPFYGLVQIGSRLAFVSRWAKNGNLEDYLKTGNPDANNRLLLCLDTAAGVEYLHKNDIVHGDLKGANVLVDSSGHAALADFGLASVTDSQILKWTTQSSVASKGGTVRWQAPELLASEDTSEKVYNTKASDVFAWGHVCYEIFTGTVPYHQHRNQTAVMLRIQRGDTPQRPDDTDPAWVRHGLTGEIWKLMRDCWAFHPSKRPNMSRVISRLKVENVVDFRLQGEWEDKVGMRFRNAQDGRAMSSLWEELDMLIKRVCPGI